MQDGYLFTSCISPMSTKPLPCIFCLKFFVSVSSPATAQQSPATMFLTTLIPLLSLLSFSTGNPQFQTGSSTMLRFGCSQIIIDRVDPLVNPAQIPSPHMHQIVGGNTFNASMPSADIGELASCTTCSFADDFSNYWTANLYFKARNGSYKRVPQVPNR